VAGWPSETVADASGKPVSERVKSGQMRAMRTCLAMRDVVCKEDDVVAHERIADTENRLVDGPCPAIGLGAGFDAIGELNHQALGAALAVVWVNAIRWDRVPSDAPV